MEERKKSKGLHIALWMVQILLAIAFLLAGFMKVVMPIEKLSQSGMTFVNQYSVGMVRFIGFAEVLGAIGLVLPAALRIRPVLTPLAAAAISVVMILALGYHISNSEPFMPVIILFALAVFVTWGRFKGVPISPKF